MDKGSYKKAHLAIVFPRGVFSTEELESTKKMKPVIEYIKSNPIDGEASAKTHKSNESEYYKSYLLLSKLKAKGVDIDKLLEE